jgi:hypothetical protein
MSKEMSECLELEVLLDAFYDGELSEEETQIVSGHLQRCDACQHKLKDIEQVAVTLRQLPKVMMPRALSADWETLIKTANIGTVDVVKTSSSVDPAGAEPVKAFNSGASQRGGHILQWRPSLVLAIAAAAVLLVLATAALQFKQQNDTPVANKSASSPGDVTSPENVPSPKLALRSQLNDSASSAKSAKYVSTGGSFSQQSSSNSEFLALYTGESPLTSEEIGISTDEDGLYALKL